MTWTELFERGADVAVDKEDVRAALATRRADGEQLSSDGVRPNRGDWRPENQSDSVDETGSTASDEPESTASDEPESTASDETEPDTSDEPESSPARVVADADVLAADLLVGGDARDALDRLRRHSWTTLVASDPLLDDAAAIITALADASLARDWFAKVAAWREPVEHPPEDHPALASAYRGGAMHVLSFDEQLTSAAAGATLRGRVTMSVRDPGAFATVFDAERLYPSVVGGEYPGPDRDPRR